MEAEKGTQPQVESMQEDFSEVPEKAQPAEEIVPEQSESEEPQLSVDAAPLAPKTVDLTREDLYAKTGALLPSEAPDGFAFESASLSEYGYSALWSKGMEELRWSIRDYREEDAQCLTAVEETKNYDLALYPIPRCDSVPEELRQIVDNPIFYAEDLTQAAVNARAYRASDAGDSDGWRMNFSVLYGTKVVKVSSKGVSPEWLYNQLAGIAED